MELLVDAPWFTFRCRLWASGLAVLLTAYGVYQAWQALLSGTVVSLEELWEVAKLSLGLRALCPPQQAVSWWSYFSSYLLSD